MNCNSYIPIAGRNIIGSDIGCPSPIAQPGIDACAVSVAEASDCIGIASRSAGTKKYRMKNDQWTVQTASSKIDGLMADTQFQYQKLWRY